MNFKKGRNQDIKLIWQKFPRVCLHIQMLALPCTNQSSPQNLYQTTYNEDNVYTFFSSLDEETACSGKIDVEDALMSKARGPRHV